ncbi:hypothetical protein DOTSEDRAFT_73050 [Dothistroma septosporum NZE10]|uniref:6-phosphogluconate dehydrogenase NADP-binding domain-containing protein n=1 Tax=Dothistroma septosporum (strain NZE10 / CBS 128990) TaxID=675120 RepID=N1PKP8_DOTSN|nr:hypothetical protein DOTSEDRAFT_73050 [Dothistroma septosporum NZE10]
MGLNMSRRLQNHLNSRGEQLKYSNRTIARGETLEKLGARVCPDFESLVQNCDVIFTMISDDAALLELSDRATGLENLTGKIFIDSSTVHPATSAAVKAKLNGKGASFVASPVFGASLQAMDGQLIFAMAGPALTIDLLRPYIIGVMGKSIIDCGEDVSTSSLMKISGNVMVLGLQELISEFQVFAERNGLSTGVTEKFIADMYGPGLEGYSKRLTTGAYAPPHSTKPGFAVPLAIKDAKHALSIANSLEMRIPTIENALANMVSARVYAGDHLDSSSMYGTLRTQAGLSFWSSNSRQGKQ